MEVGETEEEDYRHNVKTNLCINDIYRIGALRLLRDRVFYFLFLPAFLAHAIPSEEGATPSFRRNSGSCSSLL